ncbi:MAG TPA: prephenate dehydrogenase/arogenate dehydrogenase family protein, partial [Polaromonas sp.]
MSVIHFVGVGKMGLPMALHLKAAGHAVTLSDPSEERLQLARQQGLPLVQDAQVAMGRADVVFSSLPNDAALRSVAAQVGRTARRGATYVDTSTVSQQVSAEAAEVLAAAGVLYLRTTVSGNNKMAEAAQLTVMASGPRAAYDTVLPLLK